MEELENAILILFQEGHGIDKFQHEEAQSYCSNVKSLSDAWKWFLQLLRTTDHPQVKFFCWQSIAEFVDSWESYKQVNLEERQQFHQALIAWFSEATNQVSRKNPLQATTKKAINFGFVFCLFPPNKIWKMNID